MRARKVPNANHRTQTGDSGPYLFINKALKIPVLLLQPVLLLVGSLQLQLKRHQARFHRRQLLTYIQAQQHNERSFRAPTTKKHAPHTQQQGPIWRGEVPNPLGHKTVGPPNNEDRRLPLMPSHARAWLRQAIVYGDKAVEAVSQASLMISGANKRSWQY